MILVLYNFWSASRQLAWDSQLEEDFVSFWVHRLSSIGEIASGVAVMVVSTGEEKTDDVESLGWGLQIV